MEIKEKMFSEVTPILEYHYLESNMIIRLVLVTDSAMFSRISAPGVKSLWWRMSENPWSSSRIGVTPSYFINISDINSTSFSLQKDGSEIFDL